MTLENFTANFVVNLCRMAHFRIKFATKFTTKFRYRKGVELT
jgi:hypothetical protein